MMASAVGTALKAVGPCKWFLETSAAQWIALGWAGFHNIYPQTCKIIYEEVLGTWENVQRRHGITPDSERRSAEMSGRKWLMKAAQHVTLARSAQAIIATGCFWLSYKIAAGLWRMIRSLHAPKNQSSTHQPQLDDPKEDAVSTLHSLAEQVKSSRDKTWCRVVRVGTVDTGGTVVLQWGEK